jgi:hypothetical protein
MKYHVEITETLQRTIEIVARDEKEANKLPLIYTATSKWFWMKMITLIQELK